MKQGLYGNLNKLAAEVTRQQQSKRDLIVNTKNLQLSSTINDVRLNIYSENGWIEQTETTDLGLSQIATKVGIPNSYLNKLKKESPELLDKNVNHWFQHQPANRMVRTLDGKTRAFMSDRYKRIDNYPVMETILESLPQGFDINVASCDVTQNKMYLKLVSPKLEGEVAAGDPIQMGISISNSEVGLGTMTIQPFIYRLICLNGMVGASKYGEGIQRKHLGARHTLGVIFEEDTVFAQNTALKYEIRDTIKQLLSPEVFRTHLEAFKSAKEQIVTGNPVEVIKVLGQTMQLSEEDGTGIMRHLIQGGDLSRYGILNAVTRYSQDVDSYDRASELEEVGGKILALPDRQWAKIAQAA